MKRILCIVFLLLSGCEPMDLDDYLYEVDILCRYPGKEDVRERLIVDWITQSDGATILVFIDGRVRRYMGDCVFDQKKIKIKESKKIEYETKFNLKNL